MKVGLGAMNLQAIVGSSSAKVNVTLDVLERRREDGYHYIDTVMLPLDLADRIRITPASSITVECSPVLDCAPERNMAFQAAHMLRHITGVSRGAHIFIEKVIPVAGGLAGGSTNGAAILRALNQLWGAGLSEDELIVLAIRLGSDVPFFIGERPARVQGIGERITPLVMAKPLLLVLATPPVAKSTGNVYRLFDDLTDVMRPRTDEMVVALQEGDLHRVVDCLGNVFEQVMLPRHPEIMDIKRKMVAGGALGALMSGAGPTVFGIVPDEELGQRLVTELAPYSRFACLTRTVGPGVDAREFRNCYGDGSRGS